MKSKRWAWIIASTCAALASALVGSGHDATWLWRYDRALILNGEIWRLVTGPWGHLSWPHWALNVAGLSFIMGMFARLIPAWQGLVYLVIIALLTSLATLLWAPSVAWFVGLSGPLHGLFVFYALNLVYTRDPDRTYRGHWFYGPRYGWVLLAGLLLKLWIETYWPPSSPKWLGGEVVTLTHCTGALAGLVFMSLRAVWALKPR